MIINPTINQLNQPNFQWKTLPTLSGKTNGVEK